MAVPEPKTSNGRVRETEDALDIGNMLTQTARAYRQAVNAEIAQNGVTIRQSQVLGWLQKNGNLSQFQLARLLRIEPATLSGVLERMERDGLILRVADRSDGRRKMIGLNQCGEELAEVVVECSVRARLIAEHGLSPVEIETLREFLKRIIKNLSDH